jgi:signal transduction histidine kinase
LCSSPTEEGLQASRECLRAFALHLDAAIEAERVRLSRELHDEFGQSLTGVKMGLAMLRQQIEDLMPNSMLPALSDRITSMSKLIDGTIKSMRRIAMELRPPLLDRVGLGAAIKTYTQGFQERTGLRCHLRVNSQIRLLEAQAIHVYRIFKKL